MAKAARFPRKLECWVPDQIADAFDVLAADQLLTASDHMRQAFVIYLSSRGVLKPRTVMNAPHQPVGQ
jgi:hypothetical protein